MTKNIEDSFWSYFLQKSGDKIVLILSLNIIYLSIMIIYIRLNVHRESMYQSIVLYTTSWILLSLLVIASVFLIKSKKTINVFSSESSHATFWKQTGHVILLARLLFMVHSFTAEIFESTYCYTLPKRYDNNTFAAPLIVILIDVSESFLNIGYTL
jgi:hypothetical protein